MKTATAMLVATLFATPVLAAGTNVLNTTATTGTTVGTTTAAKVNTDHAVKGSGIKEVTTNAKSKDDVKIKTDSKVKAGAKVNATTSTDDDADSDE